MGISKTVLEISVARRECNAVFHYRVKNENPYLSFSMPSAYSNFAAEDYWLGG